MEKANISTLSRIGHLIKAFLKFICSCILFFSGFLQLGIVLYDIFEYSLSLSELDFLEIIFLIAFVMLTRKYIRQVKISKTGAYKGIRTFFIQQGYLLGTWLIIIFLMALTTKNINYSLHPAFNIVYLLSVLMTIRLSSIKIQTINKTTSNEDNKLESIEEATQ